MQSRSSKSRGMMTMLVPRLLWSLMIVTSVGVQGADSGPGVPDTEKSSGELTITTPHAYADVFLDTDEYSANLTIAVDANDIGTEGAVHLLALYQSNNNEKQFFMKTAKGWRLWDLTLEGWEPVVSKVLSSTETLSVLDKQNLPAGDYRIAIAYTTNSGKVVYSDSAMKFRVNDASVDTLQRFSSAQAMSSYIKEGMQNTGNASYAIPFLELADGDSSLASAASTSGNARVSTTNLQEINVDEADSVKTDGENLFVLNNCDFQACLDVYDLDGAQALAEKKAQYLLEGGLAPEGMYLVQDQPGDDTLVTVAGQNQFSRWLDVWGWSGNTTEIEFFNARQPEDLISMEKLTIDGALVSSRRIGNTLYVVTRYTPYVENFVPLALDDGFFEEGADEDTKEENENVLDETSLPELTPRMIDTREDVFDLVSAQNCYLPVSAVDRNLNPSIISITGIPIDNPTDFESVCFLGGSESLYMSTESLYLATTQWNYSVFSTDDLVYNPEHSTAIHKFSLIDGGITYKGSGEVKGHLGWNEDKKSFRMGENGEYLNVVTSIGDTWGGTSSTRLTVLKEAEFSDELETINIIDGIGKPGEQLYAARFVGERAYLVTFRVIDPLYVVDLSDQENPVIAGELEIEGYSDYLHPVSETLLLGIGKDAIPDEGSIDFGGRGAWYQGVKLSLFDVANPAAPVELDSLVLGKRGTESAVLWDHHALSFLPAIGNEPARLAIPVQLNDSIPTWKGWDGTEPSAWYDNTHTALYSFELSDLGISQAGRIISEVYVGDDFSIALDDDTIDAGIEEEDKAEEDKADGEVGDEEEIDPVDLLPRLIAPIYTNYNDRSVLLDDAVFYIHNGKVLTSFWGESLEAED